jgi:hypothetical protein
MTRGVARRDAAWNAFVKVLAEHLADTHRNFVRAHAARLKLQPLPEREIARHLRSVQRHLKTEFEWELAVVQSPGFRKAFEGQPEPRFDQALNLLICLSDVRRVVPYSREPQALLDPLAVLQAERQKAVQYLHLASRALLPLGRRRAGDDPWEKYWAEIANLAARIMAEPFPITSGQQFAAAFDPTNLRRKGKAKGEAAFRGWMVREIARWVPAAAPKRATAISELLALADVHLDAPTVTAILRRR